MNDDKVEHGGQREREGARYVDHTGPGEWSCEDQATLV